MDVISNQPVVIDNGSGVIKAGFAGEDTPKTFFPNFVGRPKHTRVMMGGVEGSTFVGSEAEQRRGLMKLDYPMEHGVVKNWENMEAVWQHIYSDELKIRSEEHPVLLTEAPLNPYKNRERTAEIFFETFNVPALFISLQAVLSLYASGRTTGVVFDSGDGVSHAVPIYDGFALNNSIMRMDVAGRDVTRRMQMLLRRQGYTFETSAEREIVRTIKEKMGYVAIDPVAEERAYLSGVRKPSSFLLPDGHTVDVDAAAYKAPEILFNPSIIGKENSGVHAMIVDSIMRADMDLRADLFNNIVLSGGSTLFKGFGDRLVNEMKSVAAKDTRIKIYAPQERKYSTWIGGSILGALGSFRQMWITAEQYEEEGPNVLQRLLFN